MSFKKPFHRNYRKMRPGHNAGYSDWAYIVDREYAIDPQHYTRAYSIIQSDIINLFQYIEPTDINNSTYSFRTHELLMRTCIEVEANFKAILRENIFTPTNLKGEPRQERSWTINDFKIINKTHHLDAYTVEFPFWRGSEGIKRPFENWEANKPLAWYQAYNNSKHDRLNNFHEANLGNLLLAFSGLFVLLSSQFRTESFATGGRGLELSIDSFFPGDFGLGGFLMINFPDNWTEDEMYDFDWTLLKRSKERFEKFNYNSLLESKITSS